MPLLTETNYTRNILTESVWSTLNEDTRRYLNAWNDVVYLIESNKHIFEAELTADQINTLFTNAEQYAVQKGDMKTGLGKAGSAVASTAKLGSDVIKQLNDKVNALGRMIQDTTPVKGIDASFEKAKQSVYDKLGGDNSKVNQAITKLSELAKAHPGAAKFAVGLLTSVAAVAGGPLGGAAAGFMLRMGNDLLQGEKLSTAVGKSAKTAAAGYLTGKAADYAKDALGFGADAAGDVASGGSNKWDQIQARQARADTLMQNPGGAVDKAGNLISPGSGVGDAAAGAAQAAGETIGRFGIPKDTIQSMAKQLSDNGLRLNLVANDPQGDAIRAQVQKQIWALSRKLAGDNVGVSSDIRSQIEFFLNNPEAMNESVFEALQFKYVAGIALTEAEQHIVNELGWDSIKQGAKKAAGAVAQGAAKAVGTAQAVGRELGQKVTAKKLNSEWQKAGSPTDAPSVVQILQKTGLDNKAITDIASISKVDLGTLAAQPAQPAPKQSGIGSAISSVANKAKGAVQTAKGAVQGAVKGAVAGAKAGAAQAQPAQQAAQPAQAQQPAQPAQQKKNTNPALQARLDQKKAQQGQPQQAVAEEEMEEIVRLAGLKAAEGIPSELKEKFAWDEVDEARKERPDDDDDWDDEDEEAPEDPEKDKVPHILMQLRKAKDVDGNHPIKFADGSKSKLSVKDIDAFMDMYMMVKPLDREKMQQVAIMSKDNFDKIVSFFKPKHGRAEKSIYDKR